MIEAVDLFGGPGGWDLGAKEIGLDPLGIEWDEAACRTREAAGLRTVQADVAALDPLDYPCELLIASPPCQAWSMAGKRQGELDKQHVNELAVAFSRGEDPPTGVEWNDERSPLAAEPMRWVHALKPRLVAFEQVPPVLELWKVCAELLREMGYKAWTGIVSAERFGVPQTRKRAILMANLGGGVYPPHPTHQEYKSGQPQWTEPELTLDGEVLPWVSMAQALGWQEGSVPSPAPTVTGGGTKSGGVEVFASKGARARVEKATTGEDQEWPHDRPAPTIVTTRRSDKGIIVGRQLPEGEGRNVGGHGYEAPEGETVSEMETEKQVSEERVFEQRQVGARPRPVDEPAPTITGTALAQGVARWNDDPDAAAEQAEQYKASREGKEVMDNGDLGNKPRSVDEPAPTILSTSRQAEWKEDGEEAAQQAAEKKAYRTNALPNATLRSEDEPAPTLVFGHASQDAGWIPEEAREAHEERAARHAMKTKIKMGNQEKATVRDEDEPAPTLLFGSRSNEVTWVEGEEPEEGDVDPTWPHERPANTVTGDERIAAGPRRERDPNYKPGDTPPSNMANAVRVTIEEAAILQTFPPDYPWQGSRSKQFEQVGNAVPPMLAKAVLSALVEG